MAKTNEPIATIACDVKTGLKTVYFYDGYITILVNHHRQTVKIDLINHTAEKLKNEPLCEAK